MNRNSAIVLIMLITALTFLIGGLIFGVQSFNHRALDMGYHQEGCKVGAIEYHKCWRKPDQEEVKDTRIIWDTTVCTPETCVPDED